MNSCYLLKWPAFISSLWTRALITSACCSCQPFWLGCRFFLSIYHDKHNYLNISFYGFYNDRVRERQVFINRRHGWPLLHLAAVTFLKERFYLMLMQQVIWLLKKKFVERLLWKCTNDIVCALKNYFPHCKPRKNTWCCSFTNHAKWDTIWPRRTSLKSLFSWKMRLSGTKGLIWDMRRKVDALKKSSKTAFEFHTQYRVESCLWIIE